MSSTVTRRMTTTLTARKTNTIVTRIQAMTSPVSTQLMSTLTSVTMCGTTNATTAASTLSTLTWPIREPPHLLQLVIATRRKILQTPRSQRKALKTLMMLRAPKMPMPTRLTTLDAAEEPMVEDVEVEGPAGTLLSPCMPSLLLTIVVELTLVTCYQVIRALMVRSLHMPPLPIVDEVTQLPILSSQCTTVTPLPLVLVVIDALRRVVSAASVRVNVKVVSAGDVSSNLKRRDKPLADRDRDSRGEEPLTMSLWRTMI